MKAINNDIHIVNASDQEQSTLEEVIRTISESRWLIAAFVIFLSLAGAFHVLIAQPIYRTEAMLKVDPQASGIGALEDFSNFSMFFTAVAALESEIEMITSRGVLDVVVDRLDLDVTARPAHLPLIGDAVARRAADGVVAEPWVDISNYDWTRDHVNLNEYAWGGERITVEYLKISDTLVGEPLTLIAGESGRYRLFDSRQAWMAEGAVGKAGEVRLPNGQPLKLLVSELVARPGTRFELTKTSRIAVSKSLKESLSVTAVGDELAPSGLVKIYLDGPDPEKITGIVNEVLRVYIQQSNDWKSSEVEKTVGLLEGQLAVVEARLNEATAALTDYQSANVSADIPMATESISGKITAVETELARLKVDRKRLSGRFTPLFTARADHVAALGDRISTLQAQKKTLEEQMTGLPDTEQQVLRLSRDVNVNRNLVTLLKTRIQELAVVNAGTLGNARVVEAAEISETPIKPEKNILLSLYVLLGVVSGTAASFLRKMLSGAVEDPDLIEKQLGLPIYAIVPYSAKQQKRVRRNKSAFKGASLTVLASTYPQDPAVESIRSLRTTLNFALFGTKRNTLLITGPAPGVGKSFLSVNLAVVLANAGKRTVVIDADMRKGHLHEYFGIKSEPGLSNLIGEDASADHVVRKTGADNLFVVPAGARPPNPSELLLHEKFASSLDELSSNFDYVIIDSPPILAVTDAAIVGRLAGATLLVIEADMHPMREIEQSVKRLKQAGVNLVGAVFNGMDTSNKRYGYAKYYGYAYAYSSTAK